MFAGVCFIHAYLSTFNRKMLHVKKAEKDMSKPKI
jgi:hypothetical protein